MTNISSHLSWYPTDINSSWLKMYHQHDVKRIEEGNLAQIERYLRFLVCFHDYWKWSKYHYFVICRLQHKASFLIQLNAYSLYPFAWWFLCLIWLLILMLIILILTLIESRSMLIVNLLGDRKFKEANQYIDLQIRHILNVNEVCPWMLMRKYMLAMLMLILVTLMVILMILKLSTDYADT